MSASIPNIPAPNISVTGDGAQTRVTRSSARRFLSTLSRRGDGMLGIVIVGLLLVALIAAPLLAPYPAAQQAIKERNEGPSALHLLGTDHLGRDLLSRIIFGTRVAMGTALPSVLAALLLGLLLGMSAGYRGGIVDSWLLVVMDALQAFPAVILALALLALLGPSSTNVIIVVALAFAPGYARVVRAQTLALRAQPFVEAGRTVGATTSRILLRHILPNLLPPLVILLAMDLPSVVTFEAGLSFLGLGVRPPTPSWGVILADGFSKIRNTPWPVLWAGLALMLTTLGFTLLGETLRDLLDPRLSQTRRA